MGEDEAKRLKRTHYIINNAVMSSGTHIVVFVCTVAFACSHTPGGLVCFLSNHPVTQHAASTMNILRVF